MNYTFEDIEFKIAVKEGFYHYEQEVSPAYLVSGTGIDWASLVVHRMPGRFREDRWFVSERTTGSAIEIPETPSKEQAVEHAITVIQHLGQEGFERVLERTQRKKEKSWQNR